MEYKIHTIHAGQNVICGILGLINSRLCAIDSRKDSRGDIIAERLEKEEKELLSLEKIFHGAEQVTIEHRVKTEKE